jgi:hypothetical protein
MTMSMERAAASHEPVDGRRSEASRPQWPEIRYRRTQARFTVPADAEARQTIHVIAEATDDGVPALTRYERFVVAVSRR